MLNHQAQISIRATSARGQGYVSERISYSPAYDAADAMDNENLATALSAQIQISMVMIKTFRKSSVEPIVLAKGGISP